MPRATAGRDWPQRASQDGLQFAGGSLQDRTISGAWPTLVPTPAGARSTLRRGAPIALDRFGQRSILGVSRFQRFADTRPHQRARRRQKRAWKKTLITNPNQRVDGKTVDKRRRAGPWRPDSSLEGLSEETNIS